MLSSEVYTASHLSCLGGLSLSVSSVRANIVSLLREHPHIITLGYNVAGLIIDSVQSGED